MLKASGNDAEKSSIVATVSTERPAHCGSLFTVS